MDPRECHLLHVPQGYVCLRREEVARLRAALARAEAAERREAKAVADRRSAEMRAALAEQERAAAVSAARAAREETVVRVAKAVEQEQRAAHAYRADINTGLVEENRALGHTISRLLAEHEALVQRVSAAQEQLDEERRAYAKVIASRGDTQTAAATSAAGLERLRAEASVREKEIASNQALATMLLEGLGAALLPMTEKLLTRMLEERIASTPSTGTDAHPASQPEVARAPHEEWRNPVVGRRGKR